jgi:regulation of enolase protein 1 (concanavalin A-like superfamily)
MVFLHRSFLGLLALGLIVGGASSREDKAQTIKGWGTVIDPKSDCSIKEEKGKLTVKVPGGSRDLNPLFGMGAPRVLQSVQGDFVVQVKVSGDFQPGEKAADPRTTPFNGAGLLIWQDDKNFLRLERNRFYVADAGRYACYPPLLEYFKDGEYQGTDPNGTLDEFFKGRSTWLRLARKGSKVVASYSHDGKEWTEVKEIPVDFADKMSVGIAAINNSTEPFKVDFEGFKVSTK